MSWCVPVVQSLIPINPVKPIRLSGGHLTEPTLLTRTPRDEVIQHADAQPTVQP